MTAVVGAPILERSANPEVLQNKIIVKFKASAATAVARNMAAAPARRSSRTSLPETVVGPLKALIEGVGVQAIRPLFVNPQAEGALVGGRSLAAATRSLSQSVTEANRKSLSGYQLIQVRSGKDVTKLIKRLNSSDAVDFAEPVANRWMSPRRESRGDPELNRQWGLSAIKWFDKVVPDASSVVVSVLDSGIDGGHPDLKDAVARYFHDGYSARDFSGHGTHVSGIIAAVANNDIGIRGVANCRLECWKVFADPNSKGQQLFDEVPYFEALNAALDNDVKVVNLSLGGTRPMQTEIALFKELRSAGVFVAAAMGNEYDDGNGINYPAAYDGVVAVGAMNEANERAEFSNTGKHIAIVAPGDNILSTVPRKKGSMARRTDYDSWPGTSMATPFVAAAAAILYATKTKSLASRDQIFSALTAKAQKLRSMKGKKFTQHVGHGLLDLGALLS